MGRRRSQVSVDEPDRAALGPLLTFAIGALVFYLHWLFLKALEEDYTALYFNREGQNWPPVRDWVAVWIPIFLLTMAIEMTYSYFTKSNLYRVNDSLSSLGCGALLTLFKKLFSQTPMAIGLYTLVWTHAGRHIQAHLPAWFTEHHLVQWWLMFVAIEFGYYWVHRTGHTMNCFWAMHSIHHSSEEYNLSTALRQSSIHTFFSNFYYLPLALVMDPPLFVIHSYFNLLYQYWIHTRVVGKLGLLEWVLNTPSQHRVHHGRNAYCIDKNYGGTLCIFDRMFGTFQEEVEEVPVVFGLTHSLNTFNPVEANLHPWRAILANMCAVDGLKNKFLVLYNGPGWVAGSDPHAEYPIPPCTNNSIQKYHTRLSTGLKLMLVAEFLVALGMMDGSIKQLETFSGAQFLCLVAEGILGGAIFWCIGITSDRHRHALKAQVILTIIAGAVLSYSQTLFEDTILPGNPTVTQRIAAVLAFAAVFLWAVGEKRREFGLPVCEETELGQDFDCAQEMEVKQLALAGSKLLPLVEKDE